MQIVKYAKEVLEQHRSFQAGDALKRKKKGQGRSWNHGLNLQKVCAQRFPEKLNKIKVCVLRRQAEEQKWDQLTEAEQKSCSQLTDVMKMNLGLESQIKGWKSLHPDKVMEKIQQNEDLKRWNVPGKVLEERRLGGKDIYIFIYYVSLYIYIYKVMN